MPVRLPVQKLVELARDRRQGPQRRRGDTRFIPRRIVVFQEQRRDDRREVRVAAALAKAVQRTVDLAGARAHSRERVGDTVFRIVVGVDADNLGWDFAGDRGDNLFNFVRQSPAIRVAENNPARSGLISRPRAGERIGRVGLVTIEEMLAIDDRLLVLHEDRLDGLADRIEVIFVGDAERDVDVIIPRFGDEDDRVRLRLHDGLEARVVRDGAPCPLRHAKGRELCIQPGRRIEEGGINRVRARIARFDVVDAERVETLRNQELVFHREVYAEGLRTIAERGVEQIQPLFLHVTSDARTLFPAGEGGRVAAG